MSEYTILVATSDIKHVKATDIFRAAAIIGNKYTAF